MKKEKRNTFLLVVIACGVHWVVAQSGTKKKEEEEKKNFFDGDDAPCSVYGRSCTHVVQCPSVGSTAFACWTDGRTAHLTRHA